jgi:hypothetical protein
MNYPVEFWFLSLVLTRELGNSGKLAEDPDRDKK